MVVAGSITRPLSLPLEEEVEVVVVLVQLEVAHLAFVRRVGRHPARTRRALPRRLAYMSDFGPSCNFGINTRTRSRGRNRQSQGRRDESQCNGQEAHRYKRCLVMKDYALCAFRY